MNDKQMSDPGFAFTLKCWNTVKAAKMLESSGNRSEARKYFADGENVCLENIRRDADLTETISEQTPRFFDVADFYSAAGESQRGIALVTEIAGKMETIVGKNE